MDVAEKPHVRTVAIDAASEGQRLDNFLAKCCKGVPVSHLHQLIRSGQVRVNGGRATAQRRLALDDRVRIPPVRMAVTAAAPRSPMREHAIARLGRALPIVFEDQVLIVIDKPAGTAAHGGSGVSSGVIEQLRGARPDASFMELVHRLDRDTSGLLVLAKTRAALRELHRQLREGGFDKRYLAIAAGRVPLRDRTQRDTLERFVTASGERRVRADPDGKVAVSHWRGLAHAAHPALGTLSLVAVRIETGRTHQIRVHLAQAGHPVLGDDKYGDFGLNRRADAAGHPRMFLHAHRLALRHPTSGAAMRLEASMPIEFQRLIGPVHSTNPIEGSPDATDRHA